MIEVRIPEDCIGKVMGDLSSRRGKILGVDVDGAFQVIRAQVPAMELYRYSSMLRSLTGGAACTPNNSATTPKCRARSSSA